MMKAKQVTLSFLLLTSVSAMAYELKIDGLYYDVKSVTDLTLTVTSGDEKYVGDVVIPSQVMYNEHKFAVAEIGKNAFSDCGELKSVVIPSSVYSIGEAAFFNTGLTSFAVPSSVVSFGKNVFGNCSKLNSVLLSETMTEIPESMFSGCASLAAVEIPASITSFADYAFKDCASLENIEISDKVTSIGKQAFAGCLKLTSFDLSDNLTIIGYEAFSKTGITKITIPGSVTQLDALFTGCQNLDSIFVAEGVSSFASSATFQQLPVRHISLPESLEGALPNNAFYFCDKLERLSIPGKVTTVGTNAFEDCTSLKEITFEPGSSEILQLGSIVGRGSLREAFGDSPLSTVYCYRNICDGFPSSFIRGNIKKVVIGNVCSSTSQQFNDCLNLSDLSIEEGVTEISAESFSGCTALTALLLPESLLSVQSSAFSGCTGLKTVTIGSALTSVGDKAFIGCSTLTDIYSKALIAPSGENLIFDNLVYMNARLHVPVGALTSYQNVYCWKAFFNISEYDFSSDVQNVDKDEFPVISVSGNTLFVRDCSKPLSVYDMNGRKIYSGVSERVELPGVGVYIVKLSGRMRKVVIR